MPARRSPPRIGRSPGPPVLSILAIFVDSVHFKRMVGALGVFVLIMIVGATGYLWLGPPGTTAVDAVYMTFITVATIGYNEIVDLRDNPAGRVFTMGIALLGIANMTFMFSTVTAFILETNLNLVYRRRRMQRTIDALQGHYIVCGIGRVSKRSIVATLTFMATGALAVLLTHHLGGVK